MRHENLWELVSELRNCGITKIYVHIMEILAKLDFCGWFYFVKISMGH